MRGERIVFLDVLRGFALSGILYAHVVIWFTGSALPPVVYSQHSGTASMLAMAFFGTFILGKFFSIFSFLFGASFHYQNEACSGLNGSASSMHIRRFATLIAIGFIHHLFWRGDILLIYGLLGFGLLLMSPVSTRALIWWSVFFLLDVPGFVASLTLDPGSLPMQEEADRHLWLMEHGTLPHFLRDNLLIFDNKLVYQLESGRLSRTFGFFLLGLYTARNQWFTTPGTYRLNNLCYRIAGGILLLMVVAAALLYAADLIRFDPERKFFMSALPLKGFYNLYNVFLSIFMITGLYRLYTITRFHKYLQVFYYPGKMAMSVYVTQTVVGLLLFYPFGLHLFSKTSPAINALLVIPVFTLQVLWCRWWLGKFEYGPLEWATRVVARNETSGATYRPGLSQAEGRSVVESASLRSLPVQGRTGFNPSDETER